MNKIWLIPGLFFFSLFLLFFISPTDPDLGWHLRCGQVFWENHSFCNQNQFSILLENYSWVNHAWVYQAILFPIFNLFGLWGLSFFNSIVLVLCFLFFYLSIKDYQFEKMLFILLIIFFGWTVFSSGIKSQTFGILFFAIELFLIYKMDKNRKLVWFFPLLFLIWANTHGSVLLGSLFLGFFLARNIILSPKSFWNETSIFVSSFLATLINPFGLNIYVDAWYHFGAASLDKLIAEWTPPGLFIYSVIFITCLALFFFCIKNPGFRYKSLSFLVLIFAFAATRARRNIPFYFMVVFFILLQLPKTESALQKWIQCGLRKKLSYTLVMLLLFFVIFFSLPINIKSDSSMENLWLRSSASGLNYPYKAVEFLKTQSVGHVFNVYEWGGFLIWNLPQDKIFVDGRMPAWQTPSNKSPYTIYLEIIQARPGWQETVEEYNISYLLIGSGTFLDLELVANSKKYSWKESYRDKFSVVYVKK